MNSLSQGYELYGRIETLEKRIVGINDELYDLQGINYEKDVVTNSRKDNYRIETLIDEKKKFKEEIVTANEELYQFCEELNKIISKIEIEELRKVLIYRYINFYDWNLIASILGISISYAYVLHRKAKKEYYKIIQIGRASCRERV